MKWNNWKRICWDGLLIALATGMLTGCTLTGNGSVTCGWNGEFCKSGMAGKKAVMVYADPVGEEAAAEIGLELPANDGSTYYEMMAVGLPEGYSYEWSRIRANEHALDFFGSLAGAEMMYLMGYHLTIQDAEGVVVDEIEPFALCIPAIENTRYSYSMDGAYETVTAADGWAVYYVDDADLSVWQCAFAEPVEELYPVLSDQWAEGDADVTVPGGEGQVENSVEETTAAPVESTTEAPTTVPVTTASPTTASPTTAAPAPEVPATTTAPQPTVPPTTAHSHAYAESARTNPTCGAAGSVTYACACGHSYQEALGATGQHSFALVSQTAPTCAAAGSNHYQCSTCGATTSEAVAATGQHVWVLTGETAPTCSAAGSKNYQCSTCGTATSEAIAATGQHTWVLQSTTPASCSAAGANHYTCSGCGTGYDEPIAATGAHNYVVIGQDQNITYQCTGCGATYAEANPNWVSWREATAEEKAQCLAAINAERATKGYAPLSLRYDLGAQAWANHLAQIKDSEHDDSTALLYDEGVGYAGSPSQIGVNQCYSCLGLAAGAGDYYNTDPFIEIGMTYNIQTGLYYYCIRH